MTRYFGILEKEPDTLWGVYFPDLPGCVAAAQSAEEALAKAEWALRDIAGDINAGGRVLPLARTIEELNADPGATLVAIPLIMDESAESLTPPLPETAPENTGTTR